MNAGLLLMPLRTGRGLNDRMHWRARAARVKKERGDVHLLWPLVWRRKAWHAPLTARLTRVSPGTRPLDDDNLRGALKAVRDQVAEELGIDDGETQLLQFTYAQTRGIWGVWIEVEES